MKKTLKPSEDFRRAKTDLIGVVSASQNKVMTREAKAALAVNTEIAESGDPSSDAFFVDLDKNSHGNSSAKSR